MWEGGLDNSYIVPAIKAIKCFFFFFFCVWGVGTSLRERGRGRDTKWSCHKQDHWWVISGWGPFWPSNFMYVCMCGCPVQDKEKKKKQFQTHMKPQKSNQNSPYPSRKWTPPGCQYLYLIIIIPLHGTRHPNLLPRPSGGRRSKDPARQLLDETDVPVLEEFTLEHFDMLEGLLLVLLQPSNVLLQPSNVLLKPSNPFVPLRNPTLGIPLPKSCNGLLFLSHGLLQGPDFGISSLCNADQVFFLGGSRNSKFIDPGFCLVEEAALDD